MSVEKFAPYRKLRMNVSFDGARICPANRKEYSNTYNVWGSNVIFKHFRADRLALVFKTVANEVNLVKERNQK